MTKLSPLLSELIESLCALPGIGPKSAQRMAFKLLQKRDAGLKLASALEKSMASINHCSQCRTYTELDVCPICSDPKRHQQQLCVVETASDIIAIESSRTYRGLYFVLHGHLSPIDAIGPNEIGLPQLYALLQASDINETIIATNSTVEGEATAHYIAEIAKELNISASRIAHGVPMGGELEYVDSQTLAHAFSGRLNYMK